ncbi:choice-of-anchor tandem repeat GloVer-containing protein [Halocola ammonii]
MFSFKSIFRRIWPNTLFWLVAFLCSSQLFLFSNSIIAQESSLWGTIYSTSESKFGVVFKTDGEGNNYEKVHGFHSGIDAENPTTNGLTQGSDGKLYGTVSSGGANGDGVLFSFNPENETTELLYTFNSGSTGEAPQGKLLRHGGGTFYGVTKDGGAHGKGTFYAFYLDPAGDFISVFNHFDGANDGAHPVGSLVQTSEGVTYGTTSSGGLYGFGTIFRYAPFDGGFEVVHHFDGVGGATPQGEMVSKGFAGIFGVTKEGGENGDGVLFKYNPWSSSNSFEVLIDFEDVDISNPQGGLVEGDSNYVFGTATSGGDHGSGGVFQFNTTFSVLNVLFSFEESADVVGTLEIQGDDKLYGLSKAGGVNGGGFLFSFDLNQSTYSTAYNFNPLQDGYSPEGSLKLFGGTLYGFTKLGGEENMGTLFSFNPNNSQFEEIVEFGVNYGTFPIAGLVESLNGKVYGMTLSGGNHNDGTIYEVNTETEEVKNVFHFDKFVNGKAPKGALFSASDGWLYGMTQQSEDGGGTLFRFDPITYEVLVLHEFEESSGWMPEGSLTESTATGKLYGTTRVGGANDEGVIFEYDLYSDTYTKVFDFGDGNGSNPKGSLLEVENGLLCGTARFGGAHSGGTLFSFDPVNLVFEKLYDFDISTSGIYPGYNLSHDNTNVIVGTTLVGDTSYGTVFDYNLITGELNIRVSLGIGAARPRGGLTKGSNGKYYGFGQLDGWQGSFIEYDPQQEQTTVKENFNFHWHTSNYGFYLHSRPIEVLPETGCPQDLDNSGFVGVDDLLHILATFGCPNLSCLQYDQNGDNEVNTNDLLIVIGMLGTTCE